ncbi:MAG TPA: DUF4880 domain-containing protein, partial [Hellea balneolensis]|nr:DUF4880 domain-containing protein [Hellea balneolensis]
MNTETQKNAEIRAQAQNWYVRLADDQAAPEDWIEFTQWLESDPRHVDAYDEIELALSGLVADAQANTHDETNNVVSLSEVRRSRWNMATTVRALAAVFVAAIVVLGVLQVQQGPTDIQQYATQIGEQKEVVLADGTHLILNTNT